QGICVLENSGVDKNVRQKVSSRTERQPDEEPVNRKAAVTGSEKITKSKKMSVKRQRNTVQCDEDEFWGE
ncbi:MAG: FtsW/RodA/SpoVE family cell cycle protein, partial [Clostridiales bacterium]|nr:FtsW/RodA/SpoVE family cell cycle protein [Clostridiales bacterium]